jgi:hypothetical protein
LPARPGRRSIVGGGSFPKVSSTRQERTRNSALIAKRRPLSCAMRHGPRQGVDEPAQPLPDSSSARSGRALAPGLRPPRRPVPTRGARRRGRRTHRMASTSAAPLMSSSVASPIKTSPAAAACWSLAATLTASPAAKRSSVSVTTSPVFTPIRPAIPSSGSDARISSAALQARRPSSSCTTGTPNTAMTASPMNFSTVPSCDSTIDFIRSKYRASTPCSASGSTDSPSAVDPTMSQNSTVTTLRRTTRIIPCLHERGEVLGSRSTPGPGWRLTFRRRGRRFAVYYPYPRHVRGARA